MISILTVAVHGGWTSWTAWSACTKSCGGGSRTRSRSCTNPLPAHGGQNCAGASSESGNCNTKECPGLYPSGLSFLLLKQYTFFHSSFILVQNVFTETHFFCAGSRMITGWSFSMIKLSEFIYLQTREYRIYTVIGEPIGLPGIQCIYYISSNSDSSNFWKS